MTSDETLLTEKEAAKYLGYSASTLATWRWWHHPKRENWRPEMAQTLSKIPFILSEAKGKPIFYKLRDLDEFLKSHPGKWRKKNLR